MDRNYRMVGALAFLVAAQSLAQTPSPARNGGFTGRGYPVYDQAAIDRGQRLFAASCGFCHGANAKGGESGPDLLRSVLVLDDEHGETIGPVILAGRAEKGMPKFALSRDQISDIAAFLHNGIRAASLHAVYPILNIVTGDPKAGQAYFNGAGHCSGCHSSTGDLKGIGAKYDPVTLQTKFLMPRGPAASELDPSGDSRSRIKVKVTWPSGEKSEGKLLHLDDFNISWVDADGVYHSAKRKGDVPQVVTEDPLQAHLDMLTKYTDADIHNLTAYLVTLK